MSLRAMRTPTPRSELSSRNQEMVEVVSGEHFARYALGGQS